MVDEDGHLYQHKITPYDIVRMHVDDSFFSNSEKFLSFLHDSIVNRRATELRNF